MIFYFKVEGSELGDDFVREGLIDSSSFEDATCKIEDDFGTSIIALNLELIAPSEITIDTCVNGEECKEKKRIIKSFVALIKDEAVW